MFSDLYPNANSHPNHQIPWLTKRVAPGISLYSPSERAAQQAIVQGTPIPPITPSPIAALHAKQRYRREGVGVKDTPKDTGNDKNESKGKAPQEVVAVAATPSRWPPQPQPQLNVGRPQAGLGRSFSTFRPTYVPTFNTPGPTPPPPHPLCADLRTNGAPRPVVKKAKHVTWADLPPSPISRIFRRERPEPQAGRLTSTPTARSLYVPPPRHKAQHAHSHSHSSGVGPVYTPTAVTNGPGRQMDWEGFPRTSRYFLSQTRDRPARGFRGGGRPSFEVSFRRAGTNEADPPSTSISDGRQDVRQDIRQDAPQNVIYQTPNLPVKVRESLPLASPHALSFGPPVIPVKLYPTQPRPSPERRITQVSWINRTIVHQQNHTATFVNWDITAPFDKCKLPPRAPFSYTHLHTLPAFMPVLPEIHISIVGPPSSACPSFSFAIQPAQRVVTPGGQYVPSIHSFMAAIEARLRAPLENALWRTLSLPEKLALARAMAARRREPLPLVVAQYADLQLPPGYVADSFMLQTVVEVLDAFVHATVDDADAGTDSGKNKNMVKGKVEKVMKVLGIDYVGERTMFNGVSWDGVRGEFRIHTTFPVLDHSVISSLYMTYAGHDLCDLK